MKNLIDSSSDFILGVVASLLAGVIIMLVSWMFNSFRKGRKQSKAEQKNRRDKLKLCLTSPNVIDRIEGYFEVLFNSLQYIILSVLLGILGIIISETIIKSFLFLMAILPILFAVREISILYRIKQKDTIFYKFSIAEALTIVKAEYGKDERFIDVTSFIQENVQDNKIEVTITNALFDGQDPFPGMPKELRILFQVGKKPAFKVLNEGQTLILPC
jgi:hypothetical protein